MLGEEFFTLLEAVPRSTTLSVNERVYIGKDKRNQIEYIIGRIKYDDLTSAAKSELPAVVETIVRQNEPRFMQFFKIAQSITPRMHAFELLPGIGKKYMWQILKEREKKPFESFKDVAQRVSLPDPAKCIVRRILQELSSEEKYHLFTRTL